MVKSKKKMYGEVFTPINLINDMLNTLPQEVWKNKELKWLDPCSGYANFFEIVYERLMIGLEEVIPNEDERKEHILNNMLFQVELQEESAKICLEKGFVNTICADYLSDEIDNKMKEVWGINKFNIIIMNPPYQKMPKNYYEN